MKGIVFVHLDWPWVYQPNILRGDMLPEAEKILNRLVKAMRNPQFRKQRTVAVIQTPKKNQKYQVPAHIQAKIQELESYGTYFQKAANDLEDVGEAIPKFHPHVTRWEVAGFWKDLCCADINYGIKQVTPSTIPANWSLFVEIELQKTYKK